MPITNILSTSSPFELQTAILISRASQQWSIAATRLASGLRINSPQDDPSGYVAAGDMQRQLTGLTRATANLQRMDGVLDLADTALAQIGKSIESLQAEVLKGSRADAGQIRNILSSINFIASSAEYQGTKLFTGPTTLLATQQSSQNNVRIAASDVSRIKSGQQTPASFQIDILADATAGKVVADFGDIGAGILTEISISVSGSTGVLQPFTFDIGTTNADIATAINGATSRTGLQATVNTDNTLTFATLGLGRDQTAIVQVRDGSVSFTDGSNGYASGTDVVARMAGREIAALGRTLNVSVPEVSMTLRLEPTTQAGILPGLMQVGILGKGRTFQLGSDVTASQQMTLGLPNVSTDTLGGQYGSLADIASLDMTDPNAASQAAMIVSDAILQLAQQRGTIGTVQKSVIAPTKATIQKHTDIITDQRNQIIGVDVAAETSRKNRSELLMQAGISALRDSHLIRAVLVGGLLN